MVEKLKYLWQNLWILPVILAVITAIYIVPKDEIYQYFFPDPTTFVSAQDERYVLEIPEDWIVYEGQEKQYKVYSDLSINSFITGILTVYKYDFVAPEDLEEYCQKDSEQISEILGISSAVKEQRNRFEESENRCVTELTVELETASDGSLKSQYHTYLTYVIGKDILMFELISPEKQLSTDLQRVFDSIELIQPVLE